MHNTVACLVDWFFITLLNLSPKDTLLQAAAGTLDGILDCVSAKHALVPLLGLLKYHGKLITVGAPAEPLELPVAPLIMGMRN